MKTPLFKYTGYSLLGIIVAVALVWAVAEYQIDRSGSRFVQYWQESDSGAQVVLMGNSFAKSNFVELEIEDVLRAKGRSMRVLNKAQNGAIGPEILRMLRTFPKEFAPPKYIVLETTFHYDASTKLNSNRSISWHDTKSTWLAILQLLSSPHAYANLARWERVKSILIEISHHMEDYASHLTLLGSDGMRSLVGLPPRSLIPVYSKINCDASLASSTEFLTGMNCLKSQGMSAFAWSEMSYEEAVKDYLKRKAALEVNESLPLSHYQKEMFDLVLHEIRSMGATPVFVTSPGVRLPVSVLEGEAHFFYASPRKLPQFYALDMQRDPLGHLSSRGAKQFSRMFAQDLSDWLDKREGLNNKI